MKKSKIIISSAIAFAVVSAIFTGCGAPSSTSASVVSNASSKSSSSPSPANKIYNVGETLKIDDTEMTVTKVDKSQGTNDFDKPDKPNNEFVIVTVSIKNDGKDQLSYNPYYFKMQNSQGQIIDSTYTDVDQSTRLNSGNLAAGGSITGTVTFEEPVNDPGLVLQYQDNVFAKGTKLQFKIS